MAISHKNGVALSGVSALSGVAKAGLAAILGVTIGGGGGTTFLFDETFEGSGAPSGWFGGGAANFDWTSDNIGDSGTQSVRLTAATSDYAFCALPAPEAELRFKLKFSIPTIGTSFTVFTLQDSGFTQMAGLIIFPDGSVTIDFVTYLPAGSIVPGAVYYLWMHYKAGPSGTWETWINTADNRPAALHLSMSIASTTLVNQFIITAQGTGNVVLFDDVKVATADFA